MRLVARQSRREVIITLCIWAVLLLAAIVALVLLRQNTARIIEQIHYVNVNRVAKASVLYAEAEKHAAQVLDKAEQLNLESEKKVVVPAGDEHLKKAITLFNEATELDQRPEFAQERRVYYEMQGQVYDAAGNREQQLLSHARAFMTQSNYDDALSNIQSAQDLSTSSVESVTLLAQLYDIQERTTEALALLNDAETSLPLSPKAHWVRGALLHKTGGVSEAVGDFQAAVSGAPKNLTYRLDLAVATSNLGKAQEASDIMQEGLNHGGWLDAAYLHVYGDYLLQAGDFKEAIRVLEQADELAPYSGDVQWSLARAYHKDGQARRASAALRRATEVKPELQEKIF